MNDVLTQARNTGKLIALDSLTYNPELKQLFCDEVQIELEPRAIELLEVLLSHVGSPLSADKIISEVWQSEYISRNVLTNRISTLRALFKQHAPNLDPNKLLVTYPKKGYFFSQDKVQLIERDLSNQTPISLVAKADVNLKQIHSMYLLALIACFALIGWLLFSSGEKTALPTATTSNITIPVVELLLSKVEVGDKESRRYRKELKILLLEQQVNYPYTNIVNQDAPDYFLAPIGEGRYWPGARNIISSDYRLNVKLTHSETEQRLNAIVDIVYDQNGKLAYRASYQLDPNRLINGVQQIGQDLVKFFQLPQLEQPKEASSNLQQSLQRPLDIVLNETLNKGFVSELTVGYLTREILASDTFDQSEIAQWVMLVENSFKFHSEETDIWLALLHFKLGNFATSHDYLIKSRFNQQVDNAFLYLVLSHIALETQQADDFRINYLKSMVALSKSVPSDVIFKRLSKPEDQQACLSPWLRIVDVPSVQHNAKTWLDTFSNYCQRAEIYLSGSKQ
ncbi:winged helix-turn-helix domain-containing protein [Vibrio tapetis]|uniref:Transcriptional regulator n=1 Tax=Vibrio tapetis subsp. tapetis TaxID=1671868 RepID=A0A2N8ZMW5_9VIBR|nr:winged helix-turn-helix domain-containing protein [Vibrio tapetis]SON53263.1 Transcriptional regulator [Vibrio tapetis subsp. tapetis]